MATRKPEEILTVLKDKTIGAIIETVCERNAIKEKLAVRTALLSSIADSLICDIDGDNPCTCQDETLEHGEEDCQSCAIRRSIWRELERDQ